MPQGGAVLAVLVQRLDVGAVAVPVLGLGQRLSPGFGPSLAVAVAVAVGGLVWVGGGRDGLVGQDEGVPVDVVDPAFQGQRELVLGDGAALAGPGSVETCPAGIRVRRARQAICAGQPAGA